MYSEKGYHSKAALGLNRAGSWHWLRVSEAVQGTSSAANAHKRSDEEGCPCHDKVTVREERKR